MKYRHFSTNLANAQRIKNNLHNNAYFLKLMVCLDFLSRLHILKIYDLTS